jgi:hypothetical protein
VRIGENPGKSERRAHADAAIRVVVPLFLPELTGYFEDGLDILEICLDSLNATTGSEVRITVVANACCAEVVDRITDRQRAGLIDRTIVSHDNLGKVDGFLAGARASWEPVVVISDADVLWRAGWPAALTAVLDAFPECGLVGAAPAPNLETYATSATVLGGLVRREVTRRTVVDPGDLARFAASVGQPDLFVGHTEDQLVVERQSVTALVGSGHFAGALRRAAVDDMPRGPGLSSERETLDLPLDQAGWWRLATPAAWALHLGNRVEPWMASELDAQVGAATELRREVDPGHPSPLGRVPTAIRDRVAERAVRAIRPEFRPEIRPGA